MSKLLAREIVQVAHDLEHQETVTSLVFATLTLFPNRFPAKWNLMLPGGKAKSENHLSLCAALRALSKNGFVVEVDKVNAWLQHIETKGSDARSRMVFSKSTLSDRSERK